MRHGKEEIEKGRAVDGGHGNRAAGREAAVAQRGGQSAHLEADVGPRADVSFGDCGFRRTVVGLEDCTKDCSRAVHQRGSGGAEKTG